jgi:hypothetical protein
MPGTVRADESPSRVARARKARIGRQRTPTGSGQRRLVDRISEQVEVTGMAGGLLDHVDQDPSQVDGTLAE